MAKLNYAKPKFNKQQPSNTNNKIQWSNQILTKIPPKIATKSILAICAILLLNWQIPLKLLHVKCDPRKYDMHKENRIQIHALHD